MAAGGHLSLSAVARHRLGLGRACHRVQRVNRKLCQLLKNQIELHLNVGDTASRGLPSSSGRIDEARLTQMFLKNCVADG